MSGDQDTAGFAELIFLHPVFLAKVWGGSRLRELYGCDLPDDKIGECLAISARPEGDCRVRGGAFDGMRLSELWSEHGELFGSPPPGPFPLQIKILDACEDLSVQVHPTAEYAATHEDAVEKNECWFVLGASATRRILIGHVAETLTEFADRARAGRWDELLRTVEMKDGDFFFIPAGTVHAILAGSLIYEVQQSSDVTYRLYDYDRLDHGVLRDLHLEQALDVVTAPSRPSATKPAVTSAAGVTRSVYTRNEHFSFGTWDVDTAATIPVDAPYLLVSVMGGGGSVNGADVVVGDHFIVPQGIGSIEVQGPLSLMVTSP